MQTNTREEYLKESAELIYASILKPAGLPHPMHHGNGYRVTCGLSQRSRSVRGQCFPVAASQDKVNEIFISPALDDTIEVLTELTYQLARATQDGRTLPPTQEWITRVSGSKGRPAIRQPTEKLLQALTLVTDLMGTYPHAALNKGKRDGTRQRKCGCYKCGAIWRASIKWVDQMDSCPCCQSENIGLDI